MVETASVAPSVTIDVWTIARKVCTERQLRCLELREKHGRSDYSIAYMLGLDRSTVRGHLRAAERNVRRALEADQVVSR